MLSYRHSLHAGNFGDVIKHIVLVEILEYLKLQDEAFDYIDTHAGAGLYRLGHGSADKPSPSGTGVARLKADDWPELACYFDIIHSFNEGDSIEYYPGSPFIAQRLMRSRDSAWLYELNPEEFMLLQNNISEQGEQIRLKLGDGFAQMPGRLPPSSGRGLVLIDPPYESESDYDTVVTVLLDAYEKFASGIYALWYPVVDRQRIAGLLDRLIASGIRHIQQFELGLTADSNNTAMTASGMIVINPPRELMHKMRLLLPRLAVSLAKDSGAFYKCAVLMD